MTFTTVKSLSSHDWPFFILAFVTAIRHWRVFGAGEKKKLSRLDVVAGMGRIDRDALDQLRPIRDDKNVLWVALSENEKPISRRGSL